MTQHSLELYRESDDPGQCLLTLGEIAVHERVIVTPVGTWPLLGSMWSLDRQPTTRQKTHTVGVVLAILCTVAGVLGVPFTCGLSLVMLFGLLFLLMKETVPHVPAVITVRSGPNFYQTAEFASSAEGARNLIRKLNYCQSLGAGLPR